MDRVSNFPESCAGTLGIETGGLDSLQLYQLGSNQENRNQSQYIKSMKLNQIIGYLVTGVMKSQKVLERNVD